MTIEVTIDEAVNNINEILHSLTYSSYEVSRDAGMPYRPTEKSIWGHNNDQLEAAYQYELKRRQLCCN